MLITHNTNVKQLFNRLAVVVKGANRELLIVIESTLLPSLGNLLKREGSVSINGID